jgi:hypothetical protein
MPQILMSALDEIGAGARRCARRSQRQHPVA